MLKNVFGKNAERNDLISNLLRIIATAKHSNTNSLRDENKNSLLTVRQDGKFHVSVKVKQLVFVSVPSRISKSLFSLLRMIIER